MKSLLTISVFTLLFSFSHFSQERNHTGIIPERLPTERPREIHKPNVDHLPGFEVIESLRLKSDSSDWQTLVRDSQKAFYEEEAFNAKDTRTTINKTLLGNGFLLIEVILQIWDGSAWVNLGKTSYTYDLNNNQTEELAQIWDGSAWGNWEKRLFTYDLNNNQTEDLYQQWNGDAWENVSKYSYHI